MPYGYTGQNLINQTVKNSGVFSISDVADLEKQGKFGGSLELIGEQTCSGNATLEFTDIKESVFGYGFGCGLEFNIFRSFLEGLKSSVELSYGSVDLEYFDFKATTFGFGVHYSL